MAEQVFAAVDLGDSGGRVLAASFDGRRLLLEEAHRFENHPIDLAGRLFWDVLAIWTEVQKGLSAVGKGPSGQVVSVGVDTWGVDFALLGRNNELLGNPYAYRDAHTRGVLEQALALVTREEIFERTGLQFMQFNTLYQLLALRLANSPFLDVAESFLMMPDLFHWLLTGVKSNEVTNASTTQFYDPRKRGWSKGLLAKLELPTHILQELQPPGTALGQLLPAVAAETGLGGANVVLPGTHDTASAVLAVPAQAAPGTAPSDWCYISSGTWSLLGVELPEPVINERCRALNFTNEGGVGGTTRLLKNITGLWIVQECRRRWAHEGRQMSWDDLSHAADAAPPRQSFILPDDPSFQSPGNMPAAIREFCKRTGQTVPATEGALIRCAVESLALRCRQVLEMLESLIGRKLATIHIVGGGTQNRQLCQATADACQRPVIAGPIEATAIGNALMQAIAAGAIGSVEEGRRLVAASFPIVPYQPRDAAAWDDAWQRFQALSPA